LPSRAMCRIFRPDGFFCCRRIASSHKATHYL
jgi:hypothetical protein